MFQLFGILLCLSACDPDARTHEAFSPLAGVRISVTDAQTKRLVDALQSIADDEHLAVAAANFPKQGRVVINMLLRVNSQTFFHIDNFNDSAQFDLAAYSHEKTQMWRPIWLRITSRLKAIFGSHVVERNFKGG
jgi:hypothetical protein